MKKTKTEKKISKVYNRVQGWYFAFRQGRSRLSKARLKAWLLPCLLLVSNLKRR